MQTWRIWVCRCAGVFWADKPRHLHCAECQQYIREIEVKRV
jgi:hypothetical protein